MDFSANGLHLSSGDCFEGIPLSPDGTASPTTFQSSVVELPTSDDSEDDWSCFPLFGWSVGESVPRFPELWGDFLIVVDQTPCVYCDQCCSAAATALLRHMGDSEC